MNAYEQGFMDKLAEMVGTQSVHTVMEPYGLGKRFTLDIEDIHDYIDTRSSDSIDLDVETYGKILEMNPWGARSVKEILDDYKSGTFKLKHSQRMRDADDTPISVMQLPEGVQGELYKGEDIGNDHYILDGYHRLARALVEGKKTVKAKLHPRDWTETKLARDFALGIPDKKSYGDTADLSKEDIVNWMVQEHIARKAGKHNDVRLGNKGLYSWATRNEIPPPGTRIPMFQQPMHRQSYLGFEGTIPPGYGAGTVKVKEQGKIKIESATSDKIKFSKGDGESFTLVRIGDQKGKPTWMLANHTKNEDKNNERI